MFMLLYACQHWSAVLCFQAWLMFSSWACLLEPKFYYANFVTNIVSDTNHESRWFVSRSLSRTLLPTFPMHCNGLNSIRATQTGLLQTCHGLCRNYLDMSRWFASATFVIRVGGFHQNFMISWFVIAYADNFRDLCLRLSPRGSFSESWRNGSLA